MFAETKMAVIRYNNQMTNPKFASPPSSEEPKPSEGDNDLPRERIEQILDRALLLATGADPENLDELRGQMNERLQKGLDDDH